MKRGIPLLAVALAACQASDDPNLIVASGHVEATEVLVSSKASGFLEALHVDEGDAVEPGQPLARIDTTDTQLALAVARADRRQAGAQLQLRLAGPRAEDIAEARARVAELQAALTGAERDLERMQGLLGSGSGTAKARDDAQTQRDRLSSGLVAAQLGLKRLESGSRVEEIEAARALLAATDAHIAQLESQLDDAEVASPLAGIVTDRLAEPGELIARGTGLLVITRLADAWLDAYVSGPDLARIRLGQDVEVMTDAGQTRAGRVSFISPRAEFTPKNVQTREERVKLVYRIKIELPNEDGLFKPGMPAQARLGVANES